MATLTIRNLDEDVKRALRRRAAERGVSMEQEARTILRESTLGQLLAPTSAPGTWRLKASKEELLALGRKPATPIDHKAEADALYDYLEDDR